MPRRGHTYDRNYKPTSPPRPVDGVRPLTVSFGMPQQGTTCHFAAKNRWPEVVEHPCWIPKLSCFWDCHWRTEAFHNPVVVVSQPHQFVESRVEQADLGITSVVKDLARRYIWSVRILAIRQEGNPFNWWTLGACFSVFPRLAKPECGSSFSHMIGDSPQQQEYLH